MNEIISVKKMREQLYNDVWAEPMTSVAKKYNISDNGVRKRCKTLNIPIPPFGYWPKKKAGKKVEERPPLPPYNEIILNDNQENARNAKSISTHRADSLVLRDLDDMQVDQISALHGLEIIEPESMEYFNSWLDSIIVPGRVTEYDNLILNHKSEIEYREARDREHPFREEYIKLRTYKEKIINRSDISVLPIAVSNSQLNRSYRIADTIIKALRKLKASISVEKNEKDNCRFSNYLS